jgi:hypothetical protein
MGDLDVRGKIINKMDLQNNWFKNMEWIQPVQDRVLCWHLIQTAKELRVPQKKEIS